jgi:hypothetical protein
MILPDEISTLVGAVGLAVVVGTRDERLVPELARAWGIHVLERGDELALCVPVASSRRTLANLADNGQLAVTLTVPSTYRSFQIKGRSLGIAPATADDLARVERHHQAFAIEVRAVGLSPERAARLYEAETEASPELMTVRMAIEDVFDQTPGPGAGSRL